MFIKFIWHNVRMSIQLHNSMVIIRQSMVTRLRLARLIWDKLVINYEISIRANGIRISPVSAFSTPPQPLAGDWWGGQLGGGGEGGLVRFNWCPNKAIPPFFFYFFKNQIMAINNLSLTNHGQESNYIICITLRL